jgi:ArsR family transcriptional regulator
MRWASRATSAIRPLSPEQRTRDAGLFAALGDDVRLEVLRMLAHRESLCVCEIQAAFDLAQPTISHHLKVLREAGLVECERRGTWMYYRLRREALKRLVAALLDLL